MARTQLHKGKGRGNGDTSQKEGFQFEVRKNFQMVKAADHWIKMPKKKKRERKFSSLEILGSTCPQGVVMAWTLSVLKGH